MKKILSILLGFFLGLMVFGCTPKKEMSIKGALELTEKVWITCVNNAMKYTAFVDFSSDEEKENTEVFASSLDESIAIIKDGKIVVGDKMGKTQVKIFTKDKEAILDVEVVSYLSYLRSLEDENAEFAYTLSTWLIQNMGSFKAPKSIELVEDGIYCFKNEQGEIDHFIAKIRGANSFGGNTVDYVMIEYDGLSKGFAPIWYGYILYEGYYQYYGVKYYVDRVLDEYKKGII